MEVQREHTHSVCLPSKTSSGIEQEELWQEEPQDKKQCYFDTRSRGSRGVAHIAPDGYADSKTLITFKVWL